MQAQAQGHLACCPSLKPTAQRLTAATSPTYPPSPPSLPLASIASLGPTRNNPCCRFRYIAASVDGSRSKKRIMLESNQSQMQMHHFMRPPAPTTARCKRLRAYPGSVSLRLCSASHSHSQSHSYSSLHQTRRYKRFAVLLRTPTYYGSYITQPAGKRKQEESGNMKKCHHRGANTTRSIEAQSPCDWG